MLASTERDAKDFSGITVNRTCGGLNYRPARAQKIDTVDWLFMA